MIPSSTSASPPAAPPPRRRTWRSSPAAQWIGFILAIGLLLWAIHQAIGRVDARSLRDQWNQFDWSIFPWLVLVMPLSAVIFPAALLWRTNRPYADPKRPLRHYEMQTLTAAGSLLNYTPVKAGLIGRIAYLKHRHGISYGASVISFTLTSIAIFAALASATGATLWRGRLDEIWGLALTLSALVSAAIGTLIVQRLLPAKIDRLSPDAPPVRHSFAWTYFHLLIWIGLALCTLGVTAVRFDLALRMMGQSLRPDELILIAVLQIFCTVLPMNGLGMRELLIGWLFGSTNPALYTGIALIDRAVETAIVVLLGIVALWVLRKRLHFRMNTQPAQEPIDG